MNDNIITQVMQKFPSRIELETGEYGLNFWSHYPLIGNISAIHRAAFGSFQIVYGFAEIFYGAFYLIPRGGKAGEEVKIDPKEYYIYIIDGRENFYHGISNILRAWVEIMPILGQVFTNIYDHSYLSTRHFYSKEFNKIALTRRSQTVISPENDPRPGIVKYPFSLEKKIRHFEKRIFNKYGRYPLFGTFAALGRIALAAAEALLGIALFFYGVYGIWPKEKGDEVAEAYNNKIKVFVSVGRELIYHATANFVRACFEGVPIMGFIFCYVYDQVVDQKDGQKMSPLRFRYTHENVKILKKEHQ